MLEKYKETFDRISAIEQEFINRCHQHPSAINDVMLELAGLYTYLNEEKTLLDVEKFKKSSQLKDDYISSQMAGVKISKASIDEKIDIELSELVIDIMTLEGKLQNCDKLISVCQSSLKSIQREGRLPNY